MGPGNHGVKRSPVSVSVSVPVPGGSTTSAREILRRLPNNQSSAAQATGWHNGTAKPRRSPSCREESQLTRAPADIGGAHFHPSSAMDQKEILAYPSRSLRLCGSIVHSSRQTESGERCPFRSPSSHQRELFHPENVVILRERMLSLGVSWV